MTAASGYTQTHRPRPGNRTTEAEPLVLLLLEKIAHIGIGCEEAAEEGEITEDTPAYNGAAGEDEDDVPL